MLPNDNHESQPVSPAKLPAPASPRSMSTLARLFAPHVGTARPLRGTVDAPNSPRPQRGQGRSDLFSKNNLRFSPPPTPPHPCRLAQKSCPAGLEIFGVRRRPAPWVHFCRKCADNRRKSLKNAFLSSCLRLGSGPAQPATRLLARPFTLAEACLKQA